MPHIHNEPGQHDFTVSAYIVRTVDPATGMGIEPVILLHMHNKFHKLLQPGGHVELNENPWEAVQHEIVEETGYDFKQLTVMQLIGLHVKNMRNPKTIQHPTPLSLYTHEVNENHKHTDISFLFVTEELPNNVPAAGESTEFYWMTAEQLNQLNAEEIASGTADVAPVALEIVSSPNNWEPTIWTQ
jgi:8-oxo-dGTP pyrophosphatase MutT (NUDIX family)